MFIYLIEAPINSTFSLLLIFKFFAFKQTDLDKWRIVFQVTSFIGIVTYLSFQLFGTAEVQKWNYPENKLPTKTAQEEDLLPNNTNET